MLIAEHEQRILKEAEEIRQRLIQYDAASNTCEYEKHKQTLDGCVGIGHIVSAGRPIPSNQYLTDNHTPTPPVIQRIETIRAAARNFLDAIDANCPSCADTVDAKRKVREAMWAANSALALGGAV